MLKQFNKKRLIILLVSLSLVIVAGVGVTVALIMTKTDPIENTFEPSFVDCAVVNNTDIKNTGDTVAYIRAAIVVTWKKDGVIWAQKPILDTDYKLEINTDNWKQIGEYYYGRTPFAVAQVKELIKSYEIIGTPPQEGYQIAIEVVAAAVQSSPDDAVKDAWGVTVDQITG